MSRNKQRGFILNPYRYAAGGGGGTPNPTFANVVALLHFDGPNGSTSFIDQAGSPKVFASFGSASLTTAQFKYGLSSGSFNGSSQYLESPDSPDWDFGTGNFTVEAWIRTTTVAAGQGVIIGRQESGTSSVFQLRRDAATIQFLARDTGGGNSITVTSSSSIAANTWYHVAACRSGSTVRLFIDGTQVGSTTISNTFTNARPLTIGAINDGVIGGYFSGQIDEVRITKGEAVYTTSFTAPTAAYPDNGVNYLDSYTTGIVGIYGIRRMISTYTGSLLRVRRSGDNTESDIGYDANNFLDTSALATFVGANNAFVTKVYDQSGGSINLQQTTTGKQPRIVSSGTYDGFIRFDGSDDCLQASANSGTTNKMTAFLRGNLRALGSLDLWLEHTADGVSNAGVACYYSAGQLNLGTGPIATARVISRYNGVFPSNNLHAYRVDRSLSGGANICVFFRNGEKLTRDTSDDAGTITGNFATALWNVGSRNNGAAIPAQLNMDAVVLCEVAKSDSDCQAISARL